MPASNVHLLSHGIHLLSRDAHCIGNPYWGHIVLLLRPCILVSHELIRRRWPPFVYLQLSFVWRSGTSRSLLV